MTKNKRAQKARRMKSKEECMQPLRVAANSVVEMVRDMPGLNGLEGGLEVDQAILAAADYNCECLLFKHLGLPNSTAAAVGCFVCCGS
jgi:hypothetical protein